MNSNRQYQINDSDGKKYLLKAIVLGSLLLLFFRWEDNMVIERYNFLKEQGVQHYAEIKNLRGRTKCIYIVEGKRFELIVRTPFQSLLNGEMYLMAYNANEIKDAIVFFDKPYIADSSLFTLTPLVSGGLKYFSDQKYVFKYNVDGVEYQRVQYLDKDKKMPSMVYYMKSNPELSYLFYEDE